MNKNPGIRSSRIRRTGSLVALAVACSLPALARAQEAQSSEELQEVTVTGSRIASTGYSTPTPVTVIDAKLLEDINATNIGAAVTQLPAFKPSNTPTTNGFGSFNVGAQILNLRGLGVNRNLVLVDGRRFAPVTREGTVDLNLIPSGLIARTDVVTGGASAAYGSDAIAGAVNVILDKRLSGIKAQVDAGTSNEGDGDVYHVSLAGGSDFGSGKGHFILGGEYEKQRGIGDCFTRSWCQGGAVVNNTGVGRVDGLPFQVRTDVGGGFQATTGGVINIINNSSAATLPIRNLFGTGGVQFNAAGQPVAYTLGRPASGTTAGAGGDSVSPFTTTQLLVPVDRFTSYGHADWDFNDDLHAFVEGSYGHVEGSTLQSRYFGAPITIFNDNPFIPAAIRAIAGVPAGLAAPASATPSGTRPATSAFNLAVLGQRRGDSSSEANTWRITFGLDGKLAGTWGWDTYYQYAKTDRDQIVLNNLVVGASRVINRPGSGGVEAPGALAYWTWANDAVYNPADAALPAAQRRIVCRATLSPNPALAAAAAGCVPFNPFGAGNASEAALDYVYDDLVEKVNIDQHVVAVNLHGDLVDLWAGPLAVATGVEYRRDSTSTIHDALSASFAYFQNFGTDYRAKQDAIEGYIETELPLLKDAAAAKLLSFNAAGRHTQYKTDGVGSYDQAAHSNKFDVNSWKIGLIWEPTDWMRMRVTRSGDIRAPNFNELFQASASNFTSVTNRWIAASAAPQFPAGLAGGNPDLEPEHAITTTIGLVLQPKWGWTERLRFSADYYNIRVSDYIGSPGAGQGIVDRCFNFNDLCSLITFATDSSGNPRGILAEIRGVNVNLQWLHTRGLDLEADYRLPLDALFGSAHGDLTFRALATRTFESATNLFGAVTDQVGTTGSAGGIPDWLVNLYATYSTGPVSVTVSGRYIPSGLYGATNIGPDDPRYSPSTFAAQQNFNGVVYSPINDNHVGGLVYFNLNGSYNIVNEGTRKVQVFASINNLFDRIPPAAPSLQYPTNPTYFDQIGRFYRVGVRMNF